ncbi:hypothetical protein QUF61_02635 [Candidatus Venteria ishoeyi]|uniref:hypothetical protein n=1 Tax=Candidatus Venteria ishoeyi TaxID=1899563 RepID=UPI0025A4F3C8|nr:hypothetical protein [Candidatus Venteria ishoeyi]MDM8545368.1 hypothetical protein [Candidatus Venteria ishoeyi]
MKKIIYLLCISAAMVVSFSHIQARLAQTRAQNGINEHVQTLALLKQQSQHLSMAQQLRSDLLPSIANLTAKIEWEKENIQAAQTFAAPAVMWLALSLWALALLLWLKWFQHLAKKRKPWKRKSSRMHWQQQAVFFSGLGFLLGSILLPLFYARVDMWMVLSLAGVGVAVTLLGIRLMKPKKANVSRNV